MEEDKLKEEESIEQESSDLYEHHRFIVDPGQAALRVDKFLLNKIGNVSRNKIQNAIKAGSVLANEKAVKANYKVKPADTISVVLSSPAREFELLPEDIPLDVLYEDDSLAVINKPPGLVVHPGSGNYTGTLVNALLHHFSKLPSSSGSNDRPGLVHRLDKDTSGVMVVGRNEIAMEFLARQFFERTIKRKYVALVWGEPEDEEGTITGNIGRHLRYRKKMAVFPDEDYGKHAVTHYKVIERFGYTTLMQFRLETGRTHQIRVHAAHKGFPVFNDDRYGGDRIVKGTIYTKYKQFVDNCFALMPHQALHARELGFIHPVTKEYMHFEQALPDYFEALLEKWRTYIKNRY